MNLLTISSSLLSAMDGESRSSMPMSLRERVDSAMRETVGEGVSESPVADDLENPFLWQFIEWMFYGEPEETGIETMEPHI